MGKVYNKTNGTNYYVVKEFKKVRTASTWHGHSKVYIFKPDKKLFAGFDVGMPDNLPYKLADDCLYFKYSENGIEKMDKVKITFPLPKMFCTKANGCEEIIFE